MCACVCVCVCVYVHVSVHACMQAFTYVCNTGFTWGIGRSVNFYTYHNVCYIYHAPPVASVSMYGARG